MAEEIKKTTETIRIIVEPVYNKEGVRQNFDEYKIVRKDEGGKLYKLKFKRDVNVAQFKGLRKFEVEVDYCKPAKNYEYPLYWVSGVHYDTIKPIMTLNK